MKPPADWPAPPEPRTRDERIELLVRLRYAINDENARVDLKQILSAIIDVVLEVLKN
jgi:hypothetical protein